MPAFFFLSRGVNFSSTFFIPAPFIQISNRVCKPNEGTCGRRFIKFD
jgi:hypothetical protein